MQRRTYLAQAAAGVTVAVSGCSSDGDAGDSGNGGDGGGGTDQSLSFGETYTTTNDIAVTVDRLEFKQSYEDVNAPGGPKQRPSVDDSKYAFLYVTVENRGDAMELAPFGSDFILQTAEKAYEKKLRIYPKNDYLDGDIAPDMTRSGAIPYYVLTELEKSDVVVEWYGESGGALTARWKPE